MVTQLHYNASFPEGGRVPCGTTPVQNASEDASVAAGGGALLMAGFEGGGIDCYDMRMSCRWVGEECSFCTYLPLLRLLHENSRVHAEPVLALASSSGRGMVVTGGADTCLHLFQQVGSQNGQLRGQRTVSLAMPGMSVVD